MAKAIMNIKMGKFKPNRAGYAAVMNSGAVQGMITSKANSVKSAADGMLSDGGYSMEGHEVKDFQGKLANGKIVRTKTDQARYTNAKRNTLLKALGSAK